MSVINIDGIDLYYHVKGQGVPIVFIHPPLLTSMDFIYQVNELSNHFTIIVFDIRGRHQNISFRQRRPWR